MRISDWSSDVCSSDLDDLDDGRLGGELLAVLEPADDFDAFVHTQRRLGVAHVMPMAGDDVRRQQHVQGLAGDILSAIAEQRLGRARSEEHTSELQKLMRISYAVFCLTKKTQQAYITRHKTTT